MSRAVVVGTTLLVLQRDPAEDDETYFDTAWHAAKRLAAGAPLEQALEDAAVHAQSVRGFDYAGQTEYSSLSAPGF